MTTTSPVECFEFQADTSHLLSLVINFLYTEKEIFLRELISNASDALGRLQLESLTNPDLLERDHKCEIRLKADPTRRTLTVSDTGIGMSRQELIENIGKIARSGTRELHKHLKESQNPSILSDLIGQFGVGFYSAFMIAEMVTISTRRAGATAATLWESDGQSSYTMSETDKADCGTDIVLHLKEPSAEGGIEDYTDRATLTAIVRKYSDFIPYPIVYQGPSGSDDPGTEIKTETKALNSMKPIWARSRAEASTNDYNDFYKHISCDLIDPLKVLPLKAEGTVQCDALLFIPARAPHDLFYQGAQAGLKLYAKRVMVMEQCEELLPRYLRFVKGVVDCSDLPLSISRQRLQQDYHIRQIRRWLTRKVLEELHKMMEEEPAKYLEFWRQFGRALKEGVGFDFENKGKLQFLLMFESSRDPKDLTTLKDYLQRMTPQQLDILYLTGESREVIENSPHLEVPKQIGYEVLYLSDPVDELLVQHLHEFEGKPLKSVAKANLRVGTEEESKLREEELKKKERGYVDFLKACQKRLDRYVKQVCLSPRLVDSPACLVTEEHEISPYLERLLREGKGARLKQRRIMELNPDHRVIARLYEHFQSNAEDPTIGDSIEMLFEMALLAEGSAVADAARLNRLTLELMERVP
jgi:molecular chaperone HtpG